MGVSEESVKIKKLGTSIFADKISKIEILLDSKEKII